MRTYILSTSCCLIKYMWEIVWRCYVVVYVVMAVVVVASGSGPSAYVRGLIRRIDRGDPNDAVAFYWRNDTHNLFRLTVFIPKSIRPRACSNIALFVIYYLITYYYF